MRQRVFQPAPDEPGVESVVAVLDQDRAMRESQERAARVLELRCAYQHRAIDVVASSRVGVDRGAAVDKRVEEGQRAIQAKTLGADLEHEERRVARGLDIESDKLRLDEQRSAADLRRVDGDLLPGHELGSAARFQVERLGAHLAIARARLAHAISSPVKARRSSTATAYTMTPAAIGTATAKPSKFLSG